MYSLPDDFILAFRYFAYYNSKLGYGLTTGQIYKYFVTELLVKNLFLPVFKNFSICQISDLIFLNSIDLGKNMVKTLSRVVTKKFLTLKEKNDPKYQSLVNLLLDPAKPRGSHNLGQSKLLSPNDSPTKPNEKVSIEDAGGLDRRS